MAKKRKVRVAFKKNRQKRTRANDLTGRYHENDLAGTDPVRTERIHAKGDLSRHRTIMEDVADPAQDQNAGQNVAADSPPSDPSCLTGRVIRIHGLVSIVQ